MRLVFIHGLAAKERSGLFEAVEREVGLPSSYVKYWDITDRFGWTSHVLAHVRKQVPDEPHILVGHSFGGLLSLYLQDENTKALVLLSPVLGISVSARLALLTEIMRNGYYYLEVSTAVILGRKDLDNFNRLTKSAPRARVPFIVVTGTEDKVIDVEAVRKRFRENRERGNWHLEISGAGHNFVGFEGAVASVVSSFLRTRRILKPPSKV